MINASTNLVVALERLEVPDAVQACWLPHPLDGLPGCHHPGVLHLGDRVQEQLETLLVVRGGEPAQGDTIWSWEGYNVWWTKLILNHV